MYVLLNTADINFVQYVVHYMLILNSYINLGGTSEFIHKFKADYHAHFIIFHTQGLKTLIKVHTLRLPLKYPQSEEKTIVHERCHFMYTLEQSISFVHPTAIFKILLMAHAHSSIAHNITQE